MTRRRVSAKTAARSAARAEERAHSVITQDTFQNWVMNFGLGTDNPTSGSTYGFNPITRNRILLEWMHRGSWMAGLAVDIPAEDMTKAGIEYQSTIEPKHIETLDATATELNIWPTIGDAIKWGRLYGGCLLVPLIDGQDMKSPLRLNTVSKGQFKGLIALDRWMVDATQEDLVTDFGPHLGQPKYYRVMTNAPALRGAVIHHSRAWRFEGVKLPYQQRLMENGWSLSVLERIYDRLTGFDAATAGSSQLVYKAYLRTLSVEGLRDIISAGGPMYTALVTWLDLQRRFQGVEGMTVIDAKDKLEVQQHSAFSGLAEVLLQLAQQLSGALQIPLVRMFGQSPSGLNSSGESELRTYNDGIEKDQKKELLTPVNIIYRLMAQSESIILPDNFSVIFRSLLRMSEKEQSEIAKTNADTICALLQAAIFDIPTAMQEVRQQARVTGVGSNITDAQIAEAIANPPVPAELQGPNGEEVQPGDQGGEGDNGGDETGGEEQGNKAGPAAVKPVTQPRLKAVS